MKKRDIERRLIPRLRSLNLDLLPILHLLLKTGSVSETARNLGLTQPAVSKALRQLRETFDDELLVLSGRRAHLTEHGQTLIAPLSDILLQLGELYEPSAPFDPSSEPLTFVINTADYVSSLLAPELDALCHSNAPNIIFQFVEQVVQTMDDLASFDVMLAPRPIQRLFGKSVQSHPLWSDEMVCVASSLDDRWHETISAEDFKKTRHIAYQKEANTPAERAALIQPTSPLEVAPSFNNSDFLVLGAIVEKGHSVALVPRMLAQSLSRVRQVKLLEIEYPNRELNVDIFWAPGASNRRGHDWSIEIIKQAADVVTSQYQAERTTEK